MPDQEMNFAVDRNGGRWSRTLSEGVMIPLDGQTSDSPDGHLNVSLPPEEAERQHGPFQWYKRPDSVAPEDYRPKSR